MIPSLGQFSVNNPPSPFDFLILYQHLPYPLVTSLPLSRNPRPLAHRMAGKKGKKSKGGEAEKKSNDAPSEREIAARVELDKLNEELSSVKMEVRSHAV